MSLKSLLSVPIFTWGFGMRRSKFFCPLLSNNIFVTTNDALSTTALDLNDRSISASDSQNDLVDMASNEWWANASNDAPSFDSVDAATSAPAASMPPQPTYPIGSVKAPVSGRRPAAAQSAAPAAAKAAENIAELSDDEIVDRVIAGSVPAWKLEVVVDDAARGVRIRRMVTERQLANSGVDGAIAMSTLPHEHYDYTKVMGVACENVVGYVPMPVGVVGPLAINGREFMVPMATTEGALVASTHRGAKAITMSGGATAAVVSDGMTRAPCVRFPSLTDAMELATALEDAEYFAQVKAAFESTSRFAKLSTIRTHMAGRTVFLRFKARTGDAMGMNMIGKACEKALSFVQERFPTMDVVSLSGNVCTDKKPSAVNWVEGRGKSVVVETMIRGDVVKKVLKTDVDAVCAVARDKNLVGSAIAGSIGGFNAHASNIVTAVFMATGQDPAQNVESSNCLTLMEPANDGRDLYMSVTMPCVEVGTVGGGTNLPAQAACLNMLGVKGAHASTPGANAQTLAQVVASTVLAGELSLMSALSAGHLIRSHLALNRAKDPAKK